MRTATAKNWFEVDAEGLARIVRRKGLAFVVYELVANCLDTRAKLVNVKLEPVEGVPKAWISVEDDDPDGFKDITHAYTLYAESDKKSDPTKRGRFNLGEKLVIAACEEVDILTTTGHIVFDQKGRTGVKTNKGHPFGKEVGSIFKGLMRLTRAELSEMRDALQLIMPPPTCQVFIDGKQIPAAEPLHTFEVSLPTEVMDEEGYLKRTARITTVRVYEPRDGVSRIYEMGIPVVDTEEPWTIEVAQKIPLNMDRDNVTPEFLRKLRAAVVNAMHAKLNQEQASLPAVQSTLGDPLASEEAKASILNQTWGEKRALQDMRDPEADDRLKSEGYNIIPINVLPKGAAKQLRESGLLILSGTISPTPKPYSEGGDPARFIPEEKWTEGMRKVASYSQGLALRLMGKEIHIRFEAGRFTAGWAANYGDRTLTFNYERLGRNWFEYGIRIDHDDLIIHEFGHEYESNHLSADFHRALTRLAAKLKRLALTEPGFFKPFDAPEAT